MQKLTIIKATDRSSVFVPLLERVSTTFYQPTIDLVDFEYDTRSFCPSQGSPLFDSLYDIYAAAGRIIDENHPEGWFEKIDWEEAMKKFSEFSGYKGDPIKADILQDIGARFYFENYALFQSEVEKSTQTHSPLVFESKIVWSNTYFNPSMWGFCLMFFNRAMGKGCVIFADALF